MTHRLLLATESAALLMRRRFVQTSAIVLLALSALMMSACGESDPVTSTAPRGATNATGSWRSVPSGPLRPREAALALWTGREVLLIGGSVTPCPPGARCVAPTTLADGAAFDPQSDSWRRIADAPAPFSQAEGFVIDTTAYVWTPGHFLAYRISDDRWERLPLPTGADGGYRIIPVGERIVAYAVGDESGEDPDFLFDPVSATWSRVPPDPLSPSFDRSMVWSGRELVLFDHELVPNPGSVKPSLTRAAALDLATGLWRRLPDSEILASGPWVHINGRLVNPTPGGADGGAVNNWGRRYPHGGILDPASGEWSTLPEPANREIDVGSGVLTESRGHFFGSGGWLLDLTKNAWIELPRLDADWVGGRSVVGIGTSLFVFGGVSWGRRAEPALHDDAWIWSPTTPDLPEISTNTELAGLQLAVSRWLR